MPPAKLGIRLQAPPEGQADKISNVGEHLHDGELSAQRGRPSVWFDRYRTYG
jgi:hypothetical protein